MTTQIEALTIVASLCADCFLNKKEEAILRKALMSLQDGTQPEQEPVACVQDLNEVKRKYLVYEKGMDWKDPLYTTPPQRTWVHATEWRGLTDDDIQQVRENCGITHHAIKTIEAKLKAKNFAEEKNT